MISSFSVPVFSAEALKLAPALPLYILAIGSSSTAGVGASSKAQSFPAQLDARLSQALGPGAAQVVNAGVSGERGPSTLRRLETYLASTPKPDLVIWQVGTNDFIFGGRAERLKQTVARGLAAAAKAGVPIIIVDQQYFPLLLNVPRYETFVAAVGAAAQKHGVPVLHRYGMMKDWAQRDPSGFRGLLSWDRFHMNDAGYACIADLLSARIVKSLSQSAPASSGQGAATVPSSPLRPAARPASAPTPTAPTSSSVGAGSSGGASSKAPMEQSSLY